MGTDIMVIAEIQKKDGWHLAFPMEKNKHWVNPDNEYTRKYGLESDNAKYHPVNEFPSRDRYFYEPIYRQPARGLPDDLSKELKEYYNTYWHDEEGTTRGHGWLSYAELKECGYGFTSLEKLKDPENIRVVYWFY